MRRCTDPPRHLLVRRSKMKFELRIREELRVRLEKFQDRRCPSKSTLETG